MSKLPITTATPSQLDVLSSETQSSGSGDAAGSPGSFADKSSRSSGYWRSLSELDQTPEFRQYIEREFPMAASEFPSGVSRRKWLQLMSASIALSGAAGCRYGVEKFAPDVNRPEGTICGVPKRYATSFELAGRAVNLLITNLDGRPIKVEGNAEHPLMRATEPNDVSKNARFKSAGTDVYSQACILGMYDPDRASRVAKRDGGSLVDSSWEEFATYAKSHFDQLRGSQGKSLAILMSPSLSPTVNRLVGEIVKALPEATVAQYKSIDDSFQRAALSQATGRPAELLYDLKSARVVCCLDCDLLGNDPNSLIYQRQFSAGRTPDPATMNRLYSVEAKFSVTGATADSRLPLRTSQMGAFLVQLDQAIDKVIAGQAAAAASDEKPFDDESLSAVDRLNRFVEAMADDLVKHKGAGLLAVGAHLPTDVQLLAMRVNQKLGNLGKQIRLLNDRSVIAGVKVVGLGELVGKLGAGIDTVWILGDNPVYTAPAGLGLGDKLSKMQHVVYLAEFEDETAKVASWSVPLAHPLESWGDVLSVDGSYGVCQPQILPVLGGRSAGEVLALLQGIVAEGSALVKATAAEAAGSPLGAADWHKLLHDGFLDRKAEELSVASLEGPVPAGSIDLETIENGKIELLLCESDTLYDGRFAKNVWLQELPQSITKLCWDNAALISPKTAEKLGLTQGIRQETSVVQISVGGQKLDLPVFLMPGQADGTIVTHLGYGRSCRDEAVNSDAEAIVGRDVSALRSLDSMHLIANVETRPSGKSYKLATTQDHFAIDDLGQQGQAERVGRLIREGTLEQITSDPKYVEHQGLHHPELKSLWKEPMDTIFETDPKVMYQWGMSIDLNKCNGCNVCVIACQAENNIPVVGKEQVLRGREMHWIRLDRYFRGSESAPQIVQQPVACAHCETAPCEQVCPVAATVHTEEGINAMAYNRCVGTRYCGNNCPYKVRRFNYLNYQTEYGYFYGWQQKGKLEEAKRKLQALVLNPEVSVRGRGVMEKCTYCLQRVQNAKIQTRSEGRRIEDGELQTACQEACPSQAIVFGDVNDPNSLVSRHHADSRVYDMLGDLNIKPRTKYLARVRNVHPRLKVAYQLESHGHGHGHDHDHHDHAAAH